MKQIYQDFLFSKGFFVGEKEEPNAAEALIALAHLFEIRIEAGHSMANTDMVANASRLLGRDVPDAFYRGFPQSVHKLTPNQLLLDQLLHYFTSYGLGIFDTPGHSVFEEDFERLCFAEDVTPKPFKILAGEEAEAVLWQYVSDLLDSTRPLSDSQYELVHSYVCDYAPAITKCPCKDTAVRLLLDTRNVAYAGLLSLPDVIRLVEQMQYRCYDSTNIKKLNLKNQDRKLLTRVLDQLLEDKCNIASCLEKKKLWNGLLHHIHYCPKNKQAEAFVTAIRGKEQRSAYSGFENRMAQYDPVGAADMLIREKGSAAFLRNLNYILSRCDTEKAVEQVLERIDSKNKIVLIQLLMRYAFPTEAGQRTFKFTRFNKLCIHKETKGEAKKRMSYVAEDLTDPVICQLRRALARACAGTVGKVYADEDMKRVALPLQENTSMGGFGVLPKGTRIPIPEGKKIRGFTYWEQVNDIDLSILGLTRDGRQREFSWRSMRNCQSEAITFSGDQTSGYNGGSEYFDVVLPAVRARYPELQYMVFCNYVYSKTPFSQCVCTAGYMMRDLEDSGAIFEPKTVASSFRITCDSTEAYLFAIDVEKNEFVWLNIAKNGNQQVAGESKVNYLKSYLNVTDVLNLYDFAQMLATEVVDDPAQADVVFSDRELTLKEGAGQIRSMDFEKVISLLNR